MKLYYSKGACSLAVRITMHELNVKSEFESVNLKNKLTETEKDFLRINPKGSVPVLVLDNNEVLTENVAIQIYLAEKFNGSQLLPNVGDMKRYRVLEWLSFIATDLHKTFGALFNPQLGNDVKDTIFKPMFKQKLSILEVHLQKNNFVAGNEFSIADSYLFVVLSWLKLIKMDIHHWPHVTKYWNALKTRPSIQQALQDEGLIEK